MVEPPLGRIPSHYVAGAGRKPQRHAEATVTGRTAGSCHRCALMCCTATSETRAGGVTTWPLAVHVIPAHETRAPFEDYPHLRYGQVYRPEHTGAPTRLMCSRHPDVSPSEHRLIAWHMACSDMLRPPPASAPADPRDFQSPGPQRISAQAHRICLGMGNPAIPP